jgi:outer membrane lipoprotein-sorting protein
MGTLKRYICLVTASLTLGVVVFATSAACGAPQAQPENARESAGGASAAAVSLIASRLGLANDVRAEFTQTQTLSAMSRPLVSTGTLVFDRRRGMIWRVETPFKATYVIGDAIVSEVDTNGNRVSVRRAQGGRGVAQVSRMMRAMLSGDLSALYSQFDVDARGTTSHWRLDLKPNQPQLAQSIQALQISGGDFMKTVRIVRANGDVTQIEFAKREALSELGPAERTLLGEK